MSPISYALLSFRRAFRAFASIALVAATFVATGCKPSIDGDVYSLASERSRVISPALIAPGAGAEYAFTIESVPTIEIVSPVSGATAWYSVDAGEYRAYSGPFALSVADPKVDQTITVAAYLSHPQYRSSDPVTQVYRFVATTVPSPSISASEEPTSYHFYYHYDTLPVITATCPLPSATIWYSLDGSSYEKYTGTFALPVTAGTNSIETHTLSMYASAEGYVDSPVTSESFRFAKNGTIVTIAGIGESSGFADGDADSALFNLPFGIVVDADVNIYVADFMNNRVRRISPDGVVSTFAGNGTSAFSGDGGPATGASISSPHSFALDEANGILYASSADSSTACVRAIDLNTGTISTFAGTPTVLAGMTPPTGAARLSASFRAILGIALKAPSSLVAIDPGFNAVFGIEDTVSLVASQLGVYGDSNLGDSALDCRFTSLYSVAFTRSGDLLVLDAKDIDGMLYRFHDGKVVSIYSALSAPRALSVTDSGIYIADSGSHCIYFIDSFGAMNAVAGTGVAGYSGDGGDATDATLRQPWGLYVVEGDGIYISDTYNHCIRKVILY